MSYTYRTTRRGENPRPRLTKATARGLDHCIDALQDYDWGIPSRTVQDIEDTDKAIEYLEELRTWHGRKFDVNFKR